MAEFDLKGPADFIGHIYSVAVDPERMGELVDSWERQLGHAVAERGATAAASDAVIAALDRVITAHAQRVSELLANFRTASFIVNQQGLIVASNDAASESFDVMPGNRLIDLPLLEDSVEELRGFCAELFEEANPSDRVARLQLEDGQRTVLAHLKSTDQQSASRHVIVVTSEQPWMKDMSALLARQFSITPQETLVLQGLTRGERVADIAKQTGRSTATIRSQIHALLTKTSLKTQTDLVRLAMTLLHATGGAATTSSSKLPGGEKLYNLMAFDRADGRVVHYRIAGDPNGQPFLLLPSGQGFIRWTDRAEAEMAQRGLKMIALVRAGYGPSSPCPKNVSPYDIAADDAAALLAAEGALSCPVLAICDDIKIALHLSRRHPMMADCPADVAALANDEIAAPLIAGTETILTPHFMAHTAWSQEIIEFAKPWSDLLLESNLPMTLLNGTGDPFSPITTVREYVTQKSSIELIEVPDAGQTMVFTHHSMVLDAVTRAQRS